jgi:sporulation protein YqfC
MENHRGILSYGEREIEINGGAVTIRLEGDGLVLRAMNAGELLITGEIFKLEFRH